MASPARKQNRIVIAALGALVLGLGLLLVLFQSSNVWKSFQIETASDTLILYGLSSLNVAAFVVFRIHLFAQRGQTRTRTPGFSARVKDKVSTLLLFHARQHSAHHRDGSILLSFP